MTWRDGFMAGVSCLISISLGLLMREPPLKIIGDGLKAAIFCGVFYVLFRKLGWSHHDD